MVRVHVPLALWLAAASPALSQSVGLGWFSQAAPLLAYAPPAVPPLVGARDDASLEDETPGAAFGAAFRAEFLVLRATSPTGFAAGLRDLIASVEADSRGYDTIHQSAKRLPDKPPSRMTIAEIRAWTKATPGQQHAIGRYQIIPRTLDMLVARLGVPETAVYSPQLQDAMADSLIADAGLEEMLAGEISRDQFLDGLAAIWAGLPNAAGRSVYHGLAGNRAGMTRASFSDRFADILPAPG
jgi:muramidase (phage lysozyme)